MSNEELPLWRRALLDGYYLASGPVRRWYARHLGAAGCAPVTVVIYHRIADDDANAWTTSRADFRAGIRWLRANFDLISLSEAQARLGNRRCFRPAVSITFDDGYAVNAETALPLLIENQIPCTYFVTADPVLRGQPFEHDRRMGNNFLPNTVEQLRTASRGGIEIGAHTRTHPNVAALTDPRVLNDELITARDDLQVAIGTAIRYFAFPFGSCANMSLVAFRLAREAGYAGVCSGFGGRNRPGADAFHLHRRGVDGPVLRMKNRVLLDPWRERHPPHFDDELDLSSPPANGSAAAPAEVPAAWVADINGDVPCAIPGHQPSVPEKS